MSSMQKETSEAYANKWVRRDIMGYQVQMKHLKDRIGLLEGVIELAAQGDQDDCYELIERFASVYFANEKV